MPPCALAELQEGSESLVARATRAPERSAETAAASPEAPLPITSTSKGFGAATGEKPTRLTLMPLISDRYGSSVPGWLGGAPAADTSARATEPPRGLDADDDEKRIARGRHNSAPRIVLEGIPAQVPEAGRERGPKKRGNRCCAHEASLSPSR